jgi:hypothetical protein
VQLINKPRFYVVQVSVKRGVSRVNQYCRLYTDYEAFLFILSFLKKRQEFYHLLRRREHPNYNLPQEQTSLTQQPRTRKEKQSNKNRKASRLGTEKLPTTIRQNRPNSDNRTPKWH